jgi:hypothetical protein
MRTMAESMAVYQAGSSLPLPGLIDMDFDFTLHGTLDVQNLPLSGAEAVARAQIRAMMRVYSDTIGWVDLFDGTLLWNGLTLARSGSFLNPDLDPALDNIFLQLSGATPIGGTVEIDIPFAFEDALFVNNLDYIALNVRFDAEAYVAEGYPGATATVDFYNSLEGGFSTDDPDAYFQSDLVPEPGSAVLFLLGLTGFVGRRRRLQL